MEILCIDIKLLKMFVQNHNLFVLHPKIWDNRWLRSLLGRLYYSGGEKIGNIGYEKLGGGGGANEVHNYGLGENGK